jgi:subtilisin family serine protease
MTLRSSFERPARTVGVAIVDSGVNAPHPHVGGVTGGVGIGPDGSEHADYLDRLGHGTAVAAAIREKAPAADLYAVKVFDRTLAASVTALVSAIDWAAGRGVQLVNLSLGTARAEHADALRACVARAAERGVWIVSAQEQDGQRWFPGCLPGVVPVRLDWECPRHSCRLEVTPDGTWVCCASGFPREIPGVPRERNLKGISFAVANVTGLLARALEVAPRPRCIEDLRRCLSG